MNDWVVLVDEADNEVGTMEKMEAHEKALLHRAFSVFVFNTRGEMLLQQRAFSKYHSPGLWTNTCCSHPRPGEAVSDAALRRLGEELGFTTHINKVFHFTYKAAFDNGLTEHEFDHVFTGTYEGAMQLNADEVKAVAYLPMEEISRLIENRPQEYTEWFKIAFPHVFDWWKKNFSGN